MKITHSTKHIQQPIKRTSSTWLNINSDSGDEGQNWHTVMFLITTLEGVLMGTFHISP